jgi:multidrug efflux pump
VLLVYVVLAAQYESWTMPITVLLIVPMTLLSASGRRVADRGDNNVFTQISFLVLAALACKNAILIVEFAKQREHEAWTSSRRCSRRAASACARADDVGRLHHGRRPLVVAHGAGAEIRRAMGIAVFSGMLGVTLFGLALTPIFYVVVGRTTTWFARRRQAPQATLAVAPAEGH